MLFDIFKKDYLNILGHLFWHICSMCMRSYVYGHTYMYHCVCLHTLGGPQLMLSIFLDHSVLFIWRQRLMLNLDLAGPASLAY